MKIRNDAPEMRSHGGWDIKVGETVDVTSDSSANWLVRHGCTEVDATPAPTISKTDGTDPVMNVPVVKPFRRKKRISRRD